MSDWEAVIPKCFAEDDLAFAETDAALAAALRLRAELREAQLSPGLLESAIEDWLHTQTSNTGQIYERMARVRKFLGG